MHKESICSWEPHFGQQVICNIFRIRRCEVHNHIKYKLGLFESRSRLWQPLCERNLKFLARRFLPQRNVSVVLLGNPVFTCAKLCAARLEAIWDFERGLCKSSWRRCHEDQGHRCQYPNCQTHIPDLLSLLVWKSLALISARLPRTRLWIGITPDCT